MIVTISGSRGIDDIEVIEKAILDYQIYPFITKILVGDATGVDACVPTIADKLDIPWEVFEADWETLGNYAGHVRNIEMLDQSGGLIAIWDGESPGTKQAIDYAKLKGLEWSIVEHNEGLF